MPVSESGELLEFSVLQVGPSHSLDWAHHHCRLKRCLLGFNLVDYATSFSVRRSSPLNLSVP